MPPKTKTAPEDPRLQVRVKMSPSLAAPIHYRVMCDEQINLTRERAFEFLELKTFDGERDVNEEWVQQLMNAYADGRFMWSHVLIATVVLNGDTYRINGQHTCWMRVNISGELSPPPRVRHVHYGVATMEQLRALYATFDQNKTRSPGHLFKAMVVGSAAAEGLPKHVLGFLQAGLKFWVEPSESRRKYVSPHELNTLVQVHHVNTFKLVGEFLKTHVGKFPAIKRAPVLAAMFATFNATPSKAFEFWETVSSGLNLMDKNEARYQLRNFLVTHRGGTVSASAGNAFIPSESLYRICVSAWNKWRKGEPVAQLRVTEKRQAVL